MKPLPKWVHSGAILGLQGGVKIVNDVLDMVKKVMGGLSDVTGVWLQDWSGQRNITGSTDLPRTGVWWNWEVSDSDRQIDKITSVHIHDDSKLRYDDFICNIVYTV